MREVLGSIPRDSLVSLSSAGDEGEGFCAAAFRTAPGPSAVRRGKGRTRTVSMTCRIYSATTRL
jgi:hypothetical protein